MNGPYDWDEDDDFEFIDEDEEAAYYAWLYNLDEPWESLSPVVERIREYVNEAPQNYTPDVVRDVEAVTRYIERGIESFERLLANHAAFDAYLAERGEASA